MAVLPRFRQLSGETVAQRRALSKVDDSAIAQAQKVISQMRNGGSVKDITGRVIRVRAVDVRALLSGQRFRFVVSEAHYQNASRGIVPEATVKASAEAVVGQSQGITAALNRSLGLGEISLDEWLTGMQNAIKNGQIAQAALARGGFENLSSATRDRIEQRVFEQFNGNAKFPGLRGFAQDIVRGRYGVAQPSNGLATRALQYSGASRLAYENEFAEAKREAGFDEVCRILAAVNHCASCAAEAARGFVSRDQAVDLGDDDCGGGCHCTQVFRRSGESSGSAVEAAIERAKQQDALIQQMRAERMKGNV